MYEKKSEGERLWYEKWEEKKKENIIEWRQEYDVTSVCRENDEEEKKTKKKIWGGEIMTRKKKMGREKRQPKTETEWRKGTQNRKKKL